MEILPPESADFIMYYNKEDRSYVITDYPDDAMSGEDDIPCWSLSALLEVLPEEVIENYYAPNLQKEEGKYSIAYGNEELLCMADNPIDACYEMIIKLNKLKML